MHGPQERRVTCHFGLAGDAVHPPRRTQPGATGGEKPAMEPSVVLAPSRSKVIYQLEDGCGQALFIDVDSYYHP